MSHKNALTMAVSGRKDFYLLMVIVFSLLMITAALSPYPFLLLIPTFILLAVAWQIPNILFANTPSESFKASLSRDEGGLSVSINAGEPAKGKLCGTQWCTRYFAVLCWRSESVVRRMVLISAHQSPESFRQLCVWLRHNNDKEGRDQS
jgi:hypothetical protein